MTSAPPPPSAQQQLPASAFSLVESVLLSLSGDGSIFHKCLDYFGDTPTIIMSLLDGKAEDDAEVDGDDATATTSAIWSRVVSFMDAFTLASLEMTCRDAYRADGFKTAERWMEWDQMLFRDAKAAELEGLPRDASAALRRRELCRVGYWIVFQLSQENLGSPLPDTLERDGRSRYRILECADSHLSSLYNKDVNPSTRRDNVADYTNLCGCSMSAVIGNKCRWRKIPVRFVHYPEGTRVYVSNLR